MSDRSPILRREYSCRVAATISLAIFFLCGRASVLFAKDTVNTLSDENRIAILRGVSSEYARARVTLPRGEKPVVLNEKGDYNTNDLNAQVMKFGPAVDVGQEFQITRIEFRSQEILFEINGGGKKKRKWTDHLQIGLGGATQPASRPGPEPAATGSSLVLRFERAVPNLTADEVKQLLGRVMNFSPQSAAESYVETLPPEFKEAVANHEARVGMDHDMVVASLGRPDRKIREKNKDGVDQEQWIYGSPPAKVLFIIFEGDKVVSIKEF
ncbi:MAG: DUF2845 domain-containing protein [Acidobacteriia bacterium]|nr:DUF2845 domain-containing protein [Terriglobia bacterium]